MRVAGRSGREGHCSVAIRLSRVSRRSGLLNGCYTRNASAPASEAAFLASRGLSHLATFLGGPNTPPSRGTFVMASQSPPLNPFPPPSCFHQPIHVTVLSPPCCACQAALWAPLTGLRACALRKKRSVRCEMLHRIWRTAPCQPRLRPPPWHAHDLVLPDFAAQAVPSQRTAPLFKAAGGQVWAVVVFAVNVRRHLPHLQHVVVGYRCDKPWIVRVGAPSEV